MKTPSPIMVALRKLKPNPQNPRVLRDERFEALKKSITDFPDMLNYRALVATSNDDGTFTVIGGNMRLKALQDLKIKEAPVMLADHWTKEQRREFIIKDNVGFGDWDWDQLANEWDAGQLSDWGLEVPNVADFSTANEEVDVDALDGAMCIKLNYTEDEYWKVKNALATIAATPEQAVLQLLKL